jgi:hypothetical protein
MIHLIKNFGIYIYNSSPNLINFKKSSGGGGTLSPNTFYYIYNGNNFDEWNNGFYAKITQYGIISLQ